MFVVGEENTTPQKKMATADNDRGQGQHQQTDNQVKTLSWGERERFHTQEQNQYLSPVGDKY